MDRVILTAAGQGTRWGPGQQPKPQWQGSLPKHLTVVEGEALLHRSVRLFRDAGADVWITGPPDDSRYEIPESTLFVPINRPDDKECSMYSWARPIWNPEGRTIHCYGDVWYSEECVQSIMSFPKREWHMWWRPHGSKTTGKQWNEVWAHSFWPEHIEMENELIRRVVDLMNQRAIPRALIYEMYKLKHGKLLPFRYTQRALGDDVTTIDDWTEDFDQLQDLDKWLARRCITITNT